MKHSDIAALMKGVAPVVRDLIVEQTRPLIEKIAELERQIAETPKPIDGRAGTDGRDGVNGKDGKDGEPGRDGKDAPEVTPEQIGEAVARYLAENPPAAGKDGRDGIDGANGKDGDPGQPGADGKDGADGSDGRDGEKGTDGAGVADAVIDREGSLVLTMTDGRTKSLGIVVGKDGRDGGPGADGRDGADGLGFDDLDLAESDDGVVLRFVRGDVTKEFPLPVIIDRGVFKEGGTYRKGNGVTWGGSFWIAQKDDPDGKPDSPDSGWRLAVKRGQNGKDAAK
jgi:hypothetical protein